MNNISFFENCLVMSFVYFEFVFFLFKEFLESQSCYSSVYYIFCIYFSNFVSKTLSWFLSLLTIFLPSEKYALFYQL